MYHSASGERIILSQSTTPRKIKLTLVPTTSQIVNLFMLAVTRKSFAPFRYVNSLVNAEKYGSFGKPKIRRRKRRVSTF